MDMAAVRLVPRLRQLRLTRQQDRLRRSHREIEIRSELDKAHLRALLALRHNFRENSGLIGNNKYTHKAKSSQVVSARKSLTGAFATVGSGNIRKISAFFDH
ncbi:MAG: hypothetical protein ACJ8EL_18110 [Rhizomicrobium sp.]